MKKPFKETKVGKILSGGFVKGVLKSIPFGVGELAGNVLDEVNGSEPGELDKKSIIPQLVKLAFYIGLAYAVLNNKITIDDAEQAKDLLAP